MIKKYIIIVLILPILLAAALPASANSGPVYMSESPSFELLMLEDCPIIVEHEQLNFDISDTKIFGWSPEAIVTAAYQMKNPTNGEYSAQMAFPFVWTPYRSAAGRISVTMNGKPLDYTMHLGENLSHLDFANDPDAFYKAAEMQAVLDGINAPAYAPFTFEDRRQSSLYTFSVGENYERLNLVVKFRIDPEKTKVLIDGFNGYTSNGDGSFELSAWYYREAEYREKTEYNYPNILVLGDDTLSGLEITTYKEYKQDEVTDSGATFVKSALSAHDYIYSRISSPLLDENLIDPTLDERFYSLALARLDGIFADGQYLADCGDIRSLVLSANYMAVLLYEAAFPPGETVELSVSYPMGATMDKRGIEDTAYTYSYVLNPARGYATFGGLDIEIKPPASAPYITASSVPFKSTDGVYTASLTGLPDEDLIFTLYPAPEVVESKSMNWPQWLTFPVRDITIAVFITAGILLAACVIIVVIRVKVRGK